MPKGKKKVVEMEVPEPLKETVEAVEVPIVSVPEEVKGEAPVVEAEEPAVATGDFHKIKRGDKFVVVNRLGQIVSQPMNEVIAQEMVQRYQGLTR